jgi:mRNA interferase YafQ
MRDIRRTTAFKRDYKREKRGRHGEDLDALLSAVILALADDEVLPPSLRDHPMVGRWSGFRDCHLKPDLLLICGKPDGETIDLVRLGSHSELFG